MNDLLVMIRRLFGQLSAFWRELPPGRRVQLTVVGLIAMAMLGGFVWSMQHVAYRPLYTGLSEAEAGEIVQRLEQMQTPYRLAAGGTTILAPEQRLDQIRLQLAAEGLPQTGRLGFELFDQTSFGATEFAEQVNFRRALEGELERTIGSLVEVRSARVHISLPRRSVFLSQEEPAKASVVLELRQGHAIGEEKTRAIAYLVANAVEGLDPEQVVVMDHLGRVFSRRYGTEGGELTDAQVEYRRKLENDAVRKILDTLEPFLGPGGARASVAMDVNWDDGEKTEEVLDPAPVAMSTQKSEERTLDGIPSGAPGTASNLPGEPTAIAQAERGVSRTQETVNYQTSRTVTHMNLERGAVERMSVAVLVDYRVTLDEQAGKLVRKPRDASELETIRQLVFAASGAVASRDSVTVESLPFTMLEEPPQVPEPPPDPADDPFTLEWFEKRRAYFIAALAGAAVLVLLGAYLRRRKRLATIRLERQSALEAEREKLRLEAAEKQQEDARRLEEERMLKGLKVAQVTSSRSQALKRHLEGVADEDPAMFARVVKSWIHEDD